MDVKTLATVAQKTWEQLCSVHLPVKLTNSTWKYSRPHQPSDVRQGWKIHIAATILSANKILETVAPTLKQRDVLYKAPTSLTELQKLNSGLYYGYCQVGKFITVYPRTLKEARSLTRELDRVTKGLPVPAVPFDFRYSHNSCVFYRYGSFESLTVEDEDGRQVPALRDPDGELVPDTRYAFSAKPDWVAPLFLAENNADASPPESPLTTTYRVFQSLTQRGKGGVYKALDFSQNPPRLCLLKEGRHCGETWWDGRDGKWFVKREEEVLRTLSRNGVPAPAIYGSFELNNNYYLVTEFVEGETLEAFLKKRQRRMPVRRALSLAFQVASLLEKIHTAGWAWGDCKPSNIIVGQNRLLRPIDFEGACAPQNPDERIWSTSAFTPENPEGLSRTQLDLYAFGVLTYYLLTGRLPTEAAGESVSRDRVPEKLSLFLRKLLSHDDSIEMPSLTTQLKMAVDEGTVGHTS